MPENHIAILDNHRPEELGFLPDMIDPNDPRSAVEQFNANYAHGGGWRPMKGFTLTNMVLHYPGDPPFKPIAMWPLRDELIVVYRYGFVMVLNTKTEAFEVARMD